MVIRCSSGAVLICDVAIKHFCIDAGQTCRRRVAEAGNLQGGKTFLQQVESVCRRLSGEFDQNVQFMTLDQLLQMLVR